MTGMKMQKHPHIMRFITFLNASMFVLDCPSHSLSPSRTPSLYISLYVHVYLSACLCLSPLILCSLSLCLHVCIFLPLFSLSACLYLSPSLLYPSLPVCISLLALYVSLLSLSLCLCLFLGIESGAPVQPQLKTRLALDSL